MGEVYGKTDGYEFNKPYELKLILEGWSIGRSSVTHDFQLVGYSDKILHFSAKGTYLLFKAIIEGSVNIDFLGGILEGTFVMKKQGQNARWEPTTKAS